MLLVFTTIWGFALFASLSVVWALGWAIASGHFRHFDEEAAQIHLENDELPWGGVDSMPSSRQR